MPPLSHTFQVTAEAYDRYMGCYSCQVSGPFCDIAGVQPGMRALDVGSGPGALTAELVERLGPGSVVAIEPSEQLADACRERFPEAEVHHGGGEELPFETDSFDAVLSQLALNFMGNPLGSVREMLRLTRPGGIVAACVWDYAGEMQMLRAFWDAATALDASARARDEGVCMHPRNPLQLQALWRDARLTDISTGDLRASVRYDGFEDLWAPLCTGVGPAGAYCAALDDDGRATLHDELFERLGSPDGPFELGARAWWVRGVSASGA